MNELEIDTEARFDLDELSALARRPRSEPGDELIAVSDSSFRVAVGSAEPLRGLQVSSSLKDQVREWTDKPRKGSQWEGVAADGAGNVLILQEHAGKNRASHIFVLAHSLDALDAVIALTVEEGRADWRGKWRRDENARGEALMLLRNGHALVVKQKDPVRLIEFGPAGSSPHGLGAACFLGPREAFEFEQQTLAEYEPLESWGLDVGEHGPLKSINDVAVADGKLYAVSRSSRRIARLDAEVGPTDGGVRVEASWKLSKDVAQPEGLVLLDGLVPIVADDQPKNGPARNNVFRLRPLGHGT